MLHRSLRVRDLLGLVTLVFTFTACKAEDEGESDSVADVESSEGSTLTTSGNDCIPGELACACNGGLCLGDLECENGICTDPTCIPGELACECNMGLCLGDLECMDGVCLPAGGTTSTSESTSDTSDTTSSDSTDGSTTDTTSTSEGSTTTSTTGNQECPAPNEMMCDGVCVDVWSNNDHCGTCGVVCKVYLQSNPDVGSCVDGACTQTWSECVPYMAGLTCDQVCGAEGKICLEEGCNGDTSINGSLYLCEIGNASSGTPQACATPISWNNNPYAACCCTP